MLPPTLLARLGPQTTKEFQSFISEKDYSYFFKKTEEVRQDELSDSDYYTCCASVVQAFGVFRLGETFLFDILQRDKEVIKKCINSFTIERDQYLEEL